MCSEIDQKTRDDPEGALVHAPAAEEWKWPTSPEGGKPEVDTYDSEAHRAFMRGLG